MRSQTNKEKLFNGLKGQCSVFITVLVGRLITFVEKRVQPLITRKNLCAAPGIKPVFHLQL